MANSHLVDYRREPILQSRIKKVRDAFGASSGLTLDEQQELMKAVAAAFADRTRPTVVVKEVTPLLIDDLLAGVNPQVLYLQRHPLAMAQSHLALGWPPNPRRINRAGIGAKELEALHAVWESGADISKLVAYFGAVESSVRDRLERAGAVTVQYESLSAGVLGDAAPLFESLEIDAGHLSVPAIDADRTDEYGVGESRKRTVAGGHAPEDVHEAFEAWMALNPSAYTEAADWDFNTN